MKYFDRKEIEDALDYPELVAKLRKSFREEYQVPERLHYDYVSGSGKKASTLLLMPAWKNKAYVGVKMISVSPYNALNNLATIQGIYVLMNAEDGQILAQFDAKSLTNMRTAAASALASTYLSREASNSMLMIGTGALAPELIRAHCAVRPIDKVLIWGRNFEKARKVADAFHNETFEVNPIENLEKNVSEVNIISTATSSPEPLVFGRHLNPGQHLDLVGAFKPTWREADEDAIVNSSVFVDTHEGTLKESGELLLPIKKGTLKAQDIRADLFDLCKNRHSGRKKDKEKTVFISVGYGLEDLAAAELIWEKYLNK